MLKLYLLLTVLVGSSLGAHIQQYVDGEFFLGLQDDVEHEEFIQFVESGYNLKLLKFFQIGKTKMLFVAGEEIDVVRASRLPEVTYWNRNAIAHIHQCAEQSAPEMWGLDRIDQRGQLPYIEPLDPSAMYTWGEDEGAGVRAYVIDTGIDINHSEFSGRATWGMSAGELPTRDDNGHGTHCAGTVGSNSYGVAKQVSLIAVKVMDEFGSGSVNDIVEGIQWVEAQHTATDRDIANLSLGAADFVPSMDAAVLALIDAGVPAIVSAGNDDADSCNYSPSRLDAAIVVGATGVEDLTYIFTNWGPCVDIFAPGSNIKSTEPFEDTAVYSGTSMAAPHVVGAIARYMSSLPEVPTPDQVAVWLNSTATPDAITFRPLDGPGSPNLLLYAPCPLA